MIHTYVTSFVFVCTQTFIYNMCTYMHTYNMLLTCACTHSCKHIHVSKTISHAQIARIESQLNLERIESQIARIESHTITHAQIARIESYRLHELNLTNWISDCTNWISCVYVCVSIFLHVYASNMLRLYASKCICMCEQKHTHTHTMCQRRKGAVSNTLTHTSTFDPLHGYIQWTGEKIGKIYI